MSSSGMPGGCPLFDVVQLTAFTLQTSAEACVKSGDLSTERAMMTVNCVFGSAGVTG